MENIKTQIFKFILKCKLCNCKSFVMSISIITRMVSLFFVHFIKFRVANKVC